MRPRKPARSVVVAESSSSDGRRKAVAPTGVKVANSTACSWQCSCTRNVWRRPVKAAGGAHTGPRQCDILPGKKMPRPVWYRVGAHRDETREISLQGSVG